MSKVLRDESEREQLALLADGFACATDNESLLAGQKWNANDSSGKLYKIIWKGFVYTRKAFIRIWIQIRMKNT